MKGLQSWLTLQSLIFRLCQFVSRLPNGITIFYSNVTSCMLYTSICKLIYRNANHWYDCFLPFFCWRRIIISIIWYIFNQHNAIDNISNRPHGTISTETKPTIISRLFFPERSIWLMLLWFCFIRLISHLKSCFRGWFYRDGWDPL